MKRNPDVQWQHRDPASLDLTGTKVAVIGGTGGIGRAISRLMASRGADVTVVGRTFRDAGTPGLTFTAADLDLMSEAERIARSLPAEDLDLLILTTGIFAAPERQETSEGLERDMAVSYLNRVVLLRNLAARLGAHRASDAPKPRVFVYGFPGSGQTAKLDDLNFEQSYGSMAAHMSTVAGNEALVIDSAHRYPGVNVYGLNPGLIKTNIRANLLGESSLKHRAMEGIIGALTPSVETYASRIVPLVASPDLEPHTAVMFDKKGRAIMASDNMTDAYAAEIVTASEALLARVVPSVTL